MSLPPCSVQWDLLTVAACAVRLLGYAHAAIVTRPSQFVLDMEHMSNKCKCHAHASRKDALGQLTQYCCAV